MTESIKTTGSGRAYFLRGKSTTLTIERVVVSSDLFNELLAIPYDIVNDAGEVVGTGVLEDCYVTAMSGPESTETMKAEPVNGLVDRDGTGERQPPCGS